MCRFQISLSVLILALLARQLARRRIAGLFTEAFLDEKGNGFFVNEQACNGRQRPADRFGRLDEPVGEQECPSEGVLAHVEVDDGPGPFADSE